MAMSSEKRTNWGQVGVIAVPYIWLSLFFLLPLLIVLKLSFSDVNESIPPYTPQLMLGEDLGKIDDSMRRWAFAEIPALVGDGWDRTKEFFGSLDAQNYSRLLNPADIDYDPLNVIAYFSSVRIALISTLIVLLIGYPMAYGMARAPKSWRPILMVMVILPFFSSLLIRVYAWIGILKPEGLLNLGLSYLGIVGTAFDADGNRSFTNPLQIMDSEIAVVIGIVYSYLPFMVLPVYATLEKMDDTLLEAARDLGCTKIGAFWRVTFPLSMPGILAGCLLVFIPAIGEYIVPELLGGADSLMIGRQLVNEFEKNRDWPFASAFAIILLIILIVPIIFYQRQQARQMEAGR
jgi:putrescine transport system permease protein